MLVKNRLLWGKVIKCICCRWLILKKCRIYYIKAAFWKLMGEADIRWGTAGVCNPITDIVTSMLERIPPHRVVFQVCEKCRPYYDCMIGIWSYFQSWAQRVFKPRNQQRQKWDRINVSRSFAGWLTFKISSLKCWDNGEKHGRKLEKHLMGQSFSARDFLLLNVPVTERVETRESRCKVLFKCFPKVSDACHQKHGSVGMFGIYPQMLNCRGFLWNEV